MSGSVSMLWDFGTVYSHKEGERCLITCTTETLGAQGVGKRCFK